jgi:DNA-binding NtrC family response regulator
VPQGAVRVNQVSTGGVVVSTEFYTYSPNPQEAAAILLVSPHPNDRASLRTILDESNWRLYDVATCGDAFDLAAWTQIPVVLCEERLPDGDWSILLDRLATLPLRPNVIVTSRLADDRLWADVLNLGGYDVLAQPFDKSEVLRVTFLALQEWKRRQEPAGKRKAAMGVELPKAAEHAA